MIYRKEYPTLLFGANIRAFLSESVVSAIEVKSKLTKGELKKALRAASEVKQLERNQTEVFRIGYVPNSILTFVVAYEGPARMSTVQKWLHDLHAELGITLPDLDASDDRSRVSAPAIDGVFVLGKGFVTFDNLPFGFVGDEKRAANPGGHWIVGTPVSLLWLFMILVTASAPTPGIGLDPSSYLDDAVANVELLP